MSIDAIKRETAMIPAERPVAANTVERTSSTTSEIDVQVMVKAVQDLQSHFSRMNPEFAVDYLSGLGIVRMRVASTGEVVFQVPDREAVQLARLIRNGASLGSLTLMRTTA